MDIIEKVLNNTGIYFFVNGEKVIYIGQSSSKIKKDSNWSMCCRIKQHFKDTDSGSILNRIPKENLIKDKRTLLVAVPIFCINDAAEMQRNLLFLESYLIGIYRPKYNYMR